MGIKAAVLVISLTVSFATRMIEMKNSFVDNEGKAQSRSRHVTWHPESEAILNDHIAIEMAAALQYRAMYAFCDRDVVNLKRTATYFEKNAKEEFQHAYELMEYQNKRGGRVEIKALDAPVHEFEATSHKSDALNAYEGALALEKRVYDSLLAVHAMCEKHRDPQCQDFIEGYLEDQIEAIDTLARYTADLTRVGPSGQAVWLWDHEFEI